MLPRIEVQEARSAWRAGLPPEGHVKRRNYRLLEAGVRAYTPSGDVHTSPAKRKQVPRYEPGPALAPPRAALLRLLRPADAALAAVLRPARRAHCPRLPADARAYLQRALLSPSPPMSGASTPEPAPAPAAPRIVVTAARSLADELLEAGGGEPGDAAHLAVPQFNLGSGWREAIERERMARLAACADDDDVSGRPEPEDAGLEPPPPGDGESVQGDDADSGCPEPEEPRPEPLPTADGECEEDECPDAALRRARRRLDALLREARALHAELAAAQRDLQSQSARAGRCAEAARALVAESHSLRYLDDLVALLRGDVAAANMAKDWPFVLDRRRPNRNYVV